MIKKVQIGDCILILGDCYECLKDIQDNSIDLIHTDPPYLIHSDGNLGQMMQKKAGKSFQKLVKANISDGIDVQILFHQFERICKCVNYQIWCSKKQFIEYLIIAHQKRWNWQDICLYRNNALSTVRGKYQDKDYLVHLWKQYRLNGTYHNKRTDYHYSIGGKKQYDHPALKPLQPCLNLIQVGSQKGDIVLDPFMGSGTTGIACIQSGRKFIGIQKDQKFFEMAVKRISQCYDIKEDVDKYFQDSLFGD